MAKASITDEYILSQGTVSTKEAATYLGMSWWALTDMLQQGKARFGMAHRGPGGRWSYTIWGKLLYKFKHGIPADNHETLHEVAEAAKRATDALIHLLELLEPKAS